MTRKKIKFASCDGRLIIGADVQHNIGAKRKLTERYSLVASWKVTCLNTRETVMEGHMRERSGNRHGRSHA